MRQYCADLVVEGSLGAYVNASGIVSSPRLGPAGCRPKISTLREPMVFRSTTQDWNGVPGEYMSRKAPPEDVIAALATWYVMLSTSPWIGTGIVGSAR